MQKRDGAFYLALWKEVSSYNRDTDQDISVAPDNVTIKFGSPKNLAVFEPSDVSNWAIGQDVEANPERTLSGMSITEPVDDAVTIIRIT